MRHSRRKELAAGLSAERLQLDVGVPRLVPEPGAFHRQERLILPRHRRPMKSRRSGASGRPFVHHHSVSRGHNEAMLSQGVGHTMSDARKVFARNFQRGAVDFLSGPQLPWSPLGCLGTRRDCPPGNGHLFVDSGRMDSCFGQIRLFSERLV